MAIKKISLSYEGEDFLIDAALDALAIMEGWTPDSVESKEELAKNRVNRFIRQEVKAYNISEAKKAAASAAEAASLQALDAITVSLNVE